MKFSDTQDSGMKQSPLPETKTFPGISILTLFLFIAASFLIYLPVISRYFVSDDFKVLSRVCLDQIIFIKSFFRPLSDISILLNYKIGGLDPVVFNSFNILIHGINAYLVFLTCLYFLRDDDHSKRNQFAFISSVIFLCYPFHNEAVVWLLGRGASMACLFCLLSILSYYKTETENGKKIFVCIFYFISLSAFESTLFFPLIFILLLIRERENVREIRRWILLIFLTLTLHLLLRYSIAGSLLGAYGQVFFHSGIKFYLLNIAKAGGRLLLPPAQNAILLTVLFLLLITISGFLAIRNYDKTRHEPFWRNFLFLSGMLLISGITPVVAGISTQTSETDRALYFPSVFLCMMAGLVMVFRIKNFRNRMFILLLICSYNLFFLEENNMNWKKASGITGSVMTKIMAINRLEKTGGKVYFLNLPNEISGAYVFRRGFTDALRLYGLDSSRFIAVNFLPRQDLEKIKGKISLDKEKETMNLPPEIILKTGPDGCWQVYDHGILSVTSQPADRIFFWNTDRLEEIQPCIPRKPV
jgi:hypothetical protein